MCCWASQWWWTIWTQWVPTGRPHSESYTFVWLQNVWDSGNGLHGRVTCQESRTLWVSHCGVACERRLCAGPHASTTNCSIQIPNVLESLALDTHLWSQLLGPVQALPELPERHIFATVPQRMDHGGLYQMYTTRTNRNVSASVCCLWVEVRAGEARPARPVGGSSVLPRQVTMLWPTIEIIIGTPISKNWFIRQAVLARMVI